MSIHKVGISIHPVYMQSVFSTNLVCIQYIRSVYLVHMQYTQAVMKLCSMKPLCLQDRCTKCSIYSLFQIESKFLIGKLISVGHYNLVSLILFTVSFGLKVPSLNIFFDIISRLYFRNLCNHCDHIWEYNYLTCNREHFKLNLL